MIIIAVLLPGELLDYEKQIYFYIFAREQFILTQLNSIQL